jgi:hypothetical protein
MTDITSRIVRYRRNRSRTAVAVCGKKMLENPIVGPEKDKLGDGSYHIDSNSRLFGVFINSKCNLHVLVVAPR